MRRREFIALLGASATAWPLGARAQRMRLVAAVSGQSRDADARNEAAFRKGLNETGYVDVKTSRSSIIGLRDAMVTSRR